MEPVLFIGIFQACFTAFYTLLKEKRQRGDLIVIMLMASLAIPMVQHLIVSFIGPRRYNNLILINAMPMLYGPLLYFYTRFEISHYRRFNPRFLLHGIPFLVILLILLIRFIIDFSGNFDIPHPGRESLTLPPRFMGKGEISFLRQVAYLWPPVLFTLSFIIYSVAILKVLKKHAGILPDYYSYESPVLTLSWLKIIIYTFIVANLFIFLVLLFYPVTGYSPLLNPYLGKIYGLSFFVYVFSIFAVKQPVIDLSPERSSEVEKAPEISRDKKYIKSGLQERESVEYLEKLTKHMEEQKPYLDGDLTIGDISEELDIPRHHITQTINTNLNQNFYGWVNSFRINEVIDRMKDPKHQDFSLMRLALDAGFNTKSSFNRIFKEQTGLTPSEYREKNV